MAIENSIMYSQSFFATFRMRKAAPQLSIVKLCLHYTLSPDCICIAWHSLPQVAIGDQNLSVSAQIDEHSEYTLDLVLQNPVNPETSTHKIYKTKVITTEIVICNNEYLAFS